MWGMRQMQLAGAFTVPEITGAVNNAALPKLYKRGL